MSLSVLLVPFQSYMRHLWKGIIVKVFGLGASELAIILPALIVGLVCGFICRLQASKKGYSETAFFCLGFFLGIIGLVVALLIPSKQSEAISNADGILKYKELLDQGVITQEEFETKKNELMKGL